MKKKQKENEETIHMAVVPSGRVDEMEEDIETLVSDVIQSRSEANILRSNNKHVLRAGVVQIEVVPTEATTFKEIMQGFSEFMETLHELHGNEHLIARIEGAEIAEQASKGEMFA
jgi:archaellum component FlaC